MGLRLIPDLLNPGPATPAGPGLLFPEPQARDPHRALRRLTPDLLNLGPAKPIWPDQFLPEPRARGPRRVPASSPDPRTPTGPGLLFPEPWAGDPRRARLSPHQTPGPHPGRAPPHPGPQHPRPATATRPGLLFPEPRARDPRRVAASSPDPGSLPARFPPLAPGPLTPHWLVPSGWSATLCVVHSGRTWVPAPGTCARGRRGWGRPSGRRARAPEMPPGKVLQPVLKMKVDELFLCWLSESSTQAMLRDCLRRIQMPAIPERGAGDAEQPGPWLAAAAPDPAWRPHECEGPRAPGPTPASTALPVGAASSVRSGPPIRGPRRSGGARVVSSSCFC